MTSQAAVKQVRYIPPNPLLNQSGRPKAKTLRVAAYCRVSTDDDDQLNSYEAQVDYYTQKINDTDGWTLAGDTAGLIRALGHSSATLIGHADGGLACWSTALLHSRLVRAIALISSPHPAALRRSTLTRRDQGYALLPTLLRYQLPIWPERLLTKDNAAEIERLVRNRSSAKWVASEDFSQTVGHLRQAIRIPAAAHCALEYQRWALRSQLRDEGRRFIRSMSERLAIPVLHLRGDLDPYVLADPVDHTRRYAPAR